MADYELRISAAHDDSCARFSPELVYSTTGPVLYWSGLANHSTTWLSFPSDLPRGAVIQYAALQIVMHSATPETSAVLRALAWWTDLEQEPAAPQIVELPVTFGPAAADEFVMLDVTNLVQAVVQHSGYANPGRICLQIEGAPGESERSIYALDDDSGYEAVMTVTATPPEPPVADDQDDDEDEEEDPMNLVVLEPLIASGNDQPVEVPRGYRLLVRATTADVEIRHVQGGTAKFTVPAGNTRRLGQSLGQQIFLRATAGTVIELALV